MCVFSVDLSVLLPSLTLVLHCDSYCKDERLQVVEIPCKRDIVKGEEIPWYSCGSLDRLRGVDCNPRPLGRHNVEVGKCCTWPNHGINHCAYLG